MIEIEKNVPIPRRRSRSKLVNTFKKMEVGDSIKLGNTTNTAGVYNAAGQAGITITIRRLDETRIQVWRVEEKND